MSTGGSGGNWPGCPVGAQTKRFAGSLLYGYEPVQRGDHHVFHDGTLGPSDPFSWGIHHRAFGSSGARPGALHAAADRTEQLADSVLCPAAAELLASRSLRFAAIRPSAIRVAAVCLAAICFAGPTEHLSTERPPPAA